MWLAHELNVLTAICSLIKTWGGGEGERTAVTKTGMQEPPNRTACISGRRTEEEAA